MTTAVVRSTPNLSIPHTQNTALVLEFSCLYTHDIRRKQKRWQDGFLRYHTFNKRVMVYDVPRNFLGDLHWTDGGQLQAGDEMTLEKGGIMVQVSEQVGQTETDLSELLHRKDKSSPANNSSSPSTHRQFPQPTAVGRATTPGRSMPGLATPRAQTTAATTQVKHRSLNSLLGPSRGPTGKAALPAKSPFELRNKEQENQEWSLDREAKRRKIDSWNLTRTTKTPKPTLTSLAPSDRSKVATGKTARSTDLAQRTLHVTDVVDLSSDTETEPFPLDSSPPQAADRTSNVNELVNPVPKNHLARNRAPTPITHVGDSPSVRHLQRKKPYVPVEPPVAKRRRQPSPPDPIKEQRQTNGTRQKSPSVSTTSDIPPSVPKPPEDISDSQKPGKALKLGGSAPRRMLVFQSQSQALKVSTSSKIPDRQRILGDRHRPANSGAEIESLPVPTPESESQPVSIHRQRLQERLARISKKQRVESSLLASHEPDGAEPAVLDIDSTAGPFPAYSRSASAKSRKPSQNEASPNNIQGSALRSNDRSPRAMLHPQSREVTPTRTIQSRDQSRPPHKAPSPPRALGQEAAKAMPPPPRPYGNAKNKGKHAPVYNTRAEGLNATMLAMPFKPPSARSTTSIPDAQEQPVKEVVKDLDLGPWSKEAFDLMDWKPPNRDAEGRLIDHDS